MKDNKIIGEIIEVSSRSAIAQSYELYDCPPIGSVVKCGDDAEDIYGVITNIETRSIDPGRRPNPKGPGFAEVNELYKSNPEITHLMKTEFNIVFLGYKHENTTTISIPPTPPRIFSFISTTVKRILAPMLFPIQLRCICLVFSGQSKSSSF